MKCKTCGQNVAETVIQKIPAKVLRWGETCEKTLTWEAAKKWCEEQGGRLPTIVELLQAYEDKIEGFAADNYWSSVENYAAFAYNVNFSGGSVANFNKTCANRVRCVQGCDK